MRRYADRLTFTVRWLPFQLNPGAPPEGVNKLDYYNAKFGPARVAQMMPHMKQVFAAEGLEYRLGGLTGSTLASHRLIDWAERQGGLGAQDRLVEELFNRYFCQEQYINDPEVLVAAATTAGLPGDAARRVVTDPSSGLAEVQRLMQRGRGVGGVPFFIINNRYKLSGAQPSEVFDEIFSEILGD